jgi:hypothetical protein
MLLEINGSLFLGVRFPRKAEEPKQGTADVLKQIAVSSGLESCGCCTGICLFPYVAQ